MNILEKFCNAVLGEFSPFRNNSASIAKERLKIVVSHERQKTSEKNPDFLNELQAELIEVIAKYIEVDKEQVKVELQRNSDRSVLELSAILPEKIEAPSN